MEMEGEFCENAITINLDTLILDNGIERLSKTLNRNERRKIKNEIQNEKNLLGINRKCCADLVMYEMGYTKWGNVGEATKCGYCGSCMNK